MRQSVPDQRPVAIDGLLTSGGFAGSWPDKVKESWAMGVFERNEETIDAFRNYLQANL